MPFLGNCPAAKLNKGFQLQIPKSWVKTYFITKNFVRKNCIVGHTAELLSD